MISTATSRVHALSRQKLVAKACLACLLPLCVNLSSAQAASRSVKDIVLDQVTPSSIAATTAPVVASNDAMVVSILVESEDGTLTPRSTNHLFRTGDRLRVKVLASRSGTVYLFNTNPAGETKLIPGGLAVNVGQETISNRLVLDRLSGEERLHVVLEPTQSPATGVLVWLNNWLGSFKSGKSRDIQLDTQNTPQATYLVSPTGQGLVTSVRLVHTR